MCRACQPHGPYLRLAPHAARRARWQPVHHKHPRARLQLRRVSRRGRSGQTKWRREPRRVSQASLSTVLLVIGRLAVWRRSGAANPATEFEMDMAITEARTKAAPARSGTPALPATARFAFS